MTLHRSGVIATGKGPEVSVASWSDGRAWLKVRSTDDWDGDHLFGDLGSLVREVPLGLGIAYLNERGDRVAIHAEDIDLVVVGSLPADSLLRVAESIGLTGLNVPTTWAEAASSSLEAARDQVPGLLSPPQLDGFDPPAIHTGPGVAVFSYAGAGNRAFLLTQTTDNELSPPLEANVRGVVFRGVNGRYSPERGALEWSEGAVGVTLLSTSLTLEELVVIAEALG
jgi:hypothetical protein